MSKMDALRAMREARYAETTARAAKNAAARPAAAKPAVAPPASVPVPAKAVPANAAPANAAPGSGVDAQADDDALCGHRNMSGRTCTREKAHAAKSHRYS